MAQMTPAALAIASLKTEGWNYSQIGKALGINPSLVRQAISPSPGQKQKPLTKYVSALTSLQGQKPGSSPSALPGRRTTKAGTTAKTRQSTKVITTKQGVTSNVTTVTKAPATLKKELGRAASGNQRVRWDIKAKKVKTKSDDKGHEGYVSGHLPSGWTAQDLQDRINNPQSGDNWRAGDINGALLAIAVEQNSSKVTSVTGVEEYNFLVSE